MSQQHLDETIEAVAHLQAAVVLDNKRHLELWVLLQLVELPGMEVGDEVAILPEYAARHPVIENFWQVMERKPEQRETDDWRNRGRYLHDTIFHKPCTRLREVHISPWNEGRVQRRVVDITYALDFRFHDWEHTWLTIAIDGAPRNALHNLLGTCEVSVASPQGPAQQSYPYKRR